jgi:hypothetical protein
MLRKPMTNRACFLLPDGTYARISAVVLHRAKDSWEVSSARLKTARYQYERRKVKTAVDHREVIGKTIERTYIQIDYQLCPYFQPFVRHNS